MKEEMIRVATVDQNALDQEAIRKSLISIKTTKIIERDILIPNQVKMRRVKSLIKSNK